MAATITARCSCGASWKVSSAPSRVAVDINDTMRKFHDDMGHHEVDAAEHKRIRARQRRAERMGLV